VDLNTDGPYSIHQEITTLVADERYKLSFYLRENEACDNADDKKMLVKVFGATQYEEYSVSSLEYYATYDGVSTWAMHTFEFAAKSENTFVEFKSLVEGSNCGPIVASVKLVSV
jgi:hypothetical protein